VIPRLALIKPRWDVIALAAAAIFGAAGAARAVSSGVVLKAEVTTPDGCRAVMMNAHMNNSSGAESAGEIGTRFCGGGGEVDVPAGWLQVSVSAYRGGQYCGHGTTYYNSAPAYRLYASNHICSNPSGTQNFYAYVGGRVWVGTGTTGYTPNPGAFIQTSPNLQF
jgi:hypothetical protein